MGRQETAFTNQLWALRPSQQANTGLNSSPGPGCLCLPAVLVSSMVCPLSGLTVLSSPVKYPGISAGRALMGPGPVGESLTTVPIQQASQGGGKSVNQQILGAD